MSKINNIKKWLSGYNIGEYIIIFLGVITLLIVAFYGVYKCVDFLENLTIQYLIQG